MSTPSHSIFLTGATSFVGGTILSSLSESHPEIQIKALIRKEAVAQELQSVYPNLTPVIGDLSSLSLLTATAAEVDFVIHAGGDNIPAVCAMIDGLALHAGTDTTPEGEGRDKSSTPSPKLVSLTGPRSLIDLSQPVTGGLRAGSRPWSDVADVRAILDVPEDRIHADADRAIVAHGVGRGVGVMLVSPGQLWGRGKGFVKRESNAAIYYNAVKSRGRAFVVEEGTATWSWTSIGDLGRAVVFLVERALMCGIGERGKLEVNEDGYYFVSTGDLSMIERARALNDRLGLGEVESVSVEVAREIHPFGHVMWGCGERTRADKLAGMGWRPRETDWRALMEEEGGERG